MNKIIDTNTKQKIAILSIALMLTSAYALSATVTFIESDFGVSKAFAESLITLPSLLIFFMTISSEIITRKIGMRNCVLLGLSLISISAIIPIILKSLASIIISRILLGLGVGIFNAHSANYINQLYSGIEKERLQGVRNAMEYVGQIVLLFFAGILIKINWYYSFIIYLFAIFILINFYKNVKEVENYRTNSKIALNKQVLIFMLIAGLCIMNITAMTVRLPSLADINLSKDTNVSFYLTLIPIVGMISSFFYGKIFEILKEKTVFIALLIYILINIVVSFSENNFYLFLLSCLIATIAQSMIMPFIFSNASRLVDSSSARFATNMMFVGCNLGAFFASIFINRVSRIIQTPSLTLGFLSFSILFMVLFRLLKNSL